VKDWTKIARLLDFTLALASLGYGLLTRSALWTGAGALGLVLAWVNIPSRLQRWAFSRRRTKQPRV